MISNVRQIKIGFGLSTVFGNFVCIDKGEEILIYSKGRILQFILLPLGKNSRKCRGKIIFSTFRRGRKRPPFVGIKIYSKVLPIHGTFAIVLNE